MSDLLQSLPDCRRCERLCAHHDGVRAQYPNYHAAPVGAWGDPRARLMIVGLAPGLHGATRTGKAFVGDSSGDFLFQALHRAGFADSQEPLQAKLSGTRITNVVKCLPPGNAPKAVEINNCREFLQQELAQFSPTGARLPRVVLTLGGVAHQAVCRALKLRNARFKHAGTWEVHRNLYLLSSFHPSRLNVNTRRITPAMLDEVLSLARMRL